MSVLDKAKDLISNDPPTLSQSGFLTGDSVALGSLLSESVTYPNEITDHPVEGAQRPTTIHTPNRSSFP